MLQFLRRHQRYFFFVITIVIIMSFSFFGTYSTLESPGMGDRVVFTAVNGQNVRHSEVEEMAIFLGSDEVDKGIWGGEWGPNFLNDGVIAKDFLQTGLAQQLVEAYKQDVGPELQQRLDREKRTAFYVHPSAPFMTAEVVWNYFAPQIAGGVSALKHAGIATDPEAVKAREQLYLSERTFPARTLKQVLRYQESQYNWLTPDPNLDRADLSLYGYHTLEDWFGPRFIRLISQFIINAAKVAEQQGYAVTKQEALADLRRQAEKNFTAMRERHNLGVGSADQYLRMQLRRMGMDENQAAAVWQQVLLFRRLFHGTADAIFVEALPFDQFNHYALEGVKGELYELPEPLRLTDYHKLQQFEVYLRAIGKNNPNSPLDLPTHFATAEELLKTYPELVAKRYQLEVSEVNAKALQGRVGIKEMWEWQTQDANWDQLKQEFPELGISLAKTPHERFAALDALNETTRARVDAEARAALVKSHSEWIDEALSQATPQQLRLSLRLKGGRLPFAGVEKREELMQVLDSAPAGADAAIDPALQRYSADGATYYRIKVLMHPKEWEVLTFAEAAAQDDTLDKLLVAVLEPYYSQIRERYPDRFRQSEGGWRPLSEVQESVADFYFKDLLAALEGQVKELGIRSELNHNALAPYRMYAYEERVKHTIESQPMLEKDWVQSAVHSDEGHLNAVQEQFKLKKRSFTVSRSDRLAKEDKETLLALNPPAWSPVVVGAEGNLWFFHAQGKEMGDLATAVAAQIGAVHEELAAEAQQHLMQHVLADIKNKGAIRLTTDRATEIDQESPTPSDQ